MSQLSVELRHAKRSNLTQVDLSKRFITSLPKELYSILSLQHLNLNYNNISHIDSSIAQLEKLQTLLLQGNDLAQLPREILHLKDLTILQLKGNPLTGKFTSLLKLDNCCKQENSLKNCFQFAENRLSATPSWLLQHHQKEISQRNSYEKDYLAQKLRISPKKKIVQRRPMSIKSQSQLDYQRQSKNGTLIANNSDLKLQKQVYKCQRYTLFKGEYCGLQVSIKVYPQENQQSISFFKNQLKIMTIYRHPNIANLLAVCQSDSLHLITQGFSKSLKEIMRNRQENLNNEQRSRIINQLASTVSFLHGNGVIHGEISSFSIFLDSNFNLKLTNFQSARHQSEISSCKINSSTHLQLYLAPQCRQLEAFTKQSDVFAIGTLVYELYARPLAVQSVQIKQFFNSPHNMEILPRHSKIKQQVWQKIKSCRSKQPFQRPTCLQLLRFKGW